MSKGRKSILDRRSGVDRRDTHNLDYFSEGGAERRRKSERRSGDERRSKWIKVDDWASVPWELILGANIKKER